MAVFEDHCRTNGLELVVLPLKRPDLNGAVKRAQSSWRYEFYASFDLPNRIDKLQPLVDAFAYRFNHHRPHQALGDLTPAEYLNNPQLRDAAVSYDVNSDSLFRRSRDANRIAWQHSLRS